MAENEENVYEDLVNEKNEEINNDEPSNQEKIPTGEVKNEPPEEPVLTEEDVKDMGIGKGFIGKPVSILKEVYKEQDKWTRQLSQQVSDLQKKFDNLDVKLTPQQKKESQENIEKEVEDKLPPMPDPIDDPEAFGNWLNKRDELTKKAFKTELKALKDEYEEKLSNSSKDVSTLKGERNYQLVWDNVDTQLKDIFKEGYKADMVEDVLKVYDQHLEGLSDKRREILKKELGGDPEEIANDMITVYKASNFGKVEQKETDKEKADNKHKEIVNKLKNSNKSFIHSASSPRERTKEEPENDFYDEIILDGEQDLKRERSET